jgi:hypothetical protein
MNMNGGSGANSLGGPVTIESGIGTATDSGAASLSTADAGVAGVSGGEKPCGWHLHWKSCGMSRDRKLAVQKVTKVCGW